MTTLPAEEAGPLVGQARKGRPVRFGFV